MGSEIGSIPGVMIPEAEQDVLICLTAGSEFYSKAIRRVTHSSVNHAFIAYRSEEWGGWWATQTDERGTVKVPVENVKHEHIECYEFPDRDLKTAMPRVRDLVGEKYDWLGIGGFLLKLYAWNVFGRKIINPLHRKGDLFCSEMCATFLQRVEGMYPWMMDLNPSGVAPGGSPHYLGTPSLQWEFKNRPENVRRVVAPW